MPQNPTISPYQQPWQHGFVAIFKCDPKQQSATEIVVADSRTITKNTDLDRVLSVLQQGMIAKREYPDARKPTIRYANFRKPEPKSINEAQALVDALLKAQTEAAVRKSAADLANRYVSIKNVQKGVLIFLISSLSSKGSRAGNCVFIFKCDFEDISQLTPKQIFRRVEDAFEEQAKKGAQYPYFDGKKFDQKTIRVFDALGETQYWLSFLNLVLAQTAAAKMQDELITTLGEIHPKLTEKYRETLQSVSKERSLVADERLIETADLLSPREVKEIVGILPGDTKISLSLDNASATVPLKEYGQKWMVADQNGTHYILIKGAALDIHGAGVNLLDLGALPTLRQAATELKMPLR